MVRRVLIPCSDDQREVNLFAHTIDNGNNFSTIGNLQGACNKVILYIDNNQS